MKLHIFESDKGDCILLETKDGRLVLCDGGMAASMRNVVRAELAKLRKKNRELDAIYVSHIDNDHITGVLQLLQDELEWRIHDFHSQNGNGTVKAPKVPRPPKIRGIWHNAFRDQLKGNSGPLEELIANAVPACFALGTPRGLEIAQELEQIATAVPEAIKVGHLASSELLDIPVNVVPGKHRPGPLLIIRGELAPFDLGSSRWTVIGPAEKELKDLRTGWNNWLRANREVVKRIQREMRERAEEFSTGLSESSPFDLGDWNGVPDFESVTAPNIASLIFLVEEGGKRVLLTGDAHHDFILKGLEEENLLVDRGIHLDVLKVQHHGSEHNTDAEFCRTVSADDYVFCGNGENGNPEPSVLKLFFESRLGPADVQARAPKAKNRKFTFWFSTNSTLLKPGGKDRTAFEEVEQLVAGMVQQSNGRLRAVFNPGPKITLTV